MALQDLTKTYMPADAPVSLAAVASSGAHVM
jgi:hypothetical protein